MAGINTTPPGATTAATVRHQESTMTKLSNNTITAAAANNVTAAQLKSEVAQYDTKGDTARAVNTFAREIVAEFAPATNVEELPKLGATFTRGEAYSGVAGGKDVPVFMGRRSVLATGVLHADGSLTTNGVRHGSPSRADVEVAKARGSKNGPRRSGWKAWLYVDTKGNVRPIEHLREGGTEQVRSRTSSVRTIETTKRVRELKAIARREAKGKLTAVGQW